MNTPGRDNPIGASTASEAARQAYWLLHIGFTVAVILAGLDKFVGVLTEWTQYLWPAIPNLLGVTAGAFMMIVGAIEVAAGVLAAIRPRIGGYVISAWLVGIIINLLLLGDFYDIALRDLGLAIGAFALARLSLAYGHRGVG